MTEILRERAEHAARYGANLVVPARQIKQILDQLAALRTAASVEGLVRAIVAVTPCTCSAQRKRADRAEDHLQAVRKLHTADADGNCSHCTRGRLYPVPAPCDSAAALAEGGDD